MEEFRYKTKKVWPQKRKDRTGYWLSFLDLGGRRRQYRYPTRELRDAAMHQIKTELEAQLNAWALPLSVRPFIDMARDYAHALSGAAPNHCREVDRVLDYFRRIVNPRSSNAIRPQHIEDYLAARLAGYPAQLDAQGRPLLDEHKRPRLHRPAGSATLSKEWGILHALFEWGAHPQRRFCLANPVKAVRRPHVPHRVKDSPTADEWVRVLEAIGDPALPLENRQAWHLLILMGVITELRQSVLLSTWIARPNKRQQEELRRNTHEPWAYLELGDAASGNVGILHAFTGKTHKESVHGLPPLLNERLAKRVCDLSDPDHEATHLPRLFPWGRFQVKAFHRIMTHARCPYDFHSLRRAGGTGIAIHAGEQAASAALDHADVRVTQRHYLSDRRLARAVAAKLALPALPPLPAYLPSPAPASA